jgi:hypothetical protein
MNEQGSTKAVGASAGKEMIAGMELEVRLMELEVRLEERWRCQMGYEAAAEVVQDRWNWANALAK